MAIPRRAGAETAAPLVPPRPTLPALHQAAAGCRACDLWRRGTQTVFGEGAAPADVVLVGEQPGDQEDVQGLPFVGPAGKLLDRALEAAGIDRSRVYVTNVVKHFKWEPRGKRRIRAKPNAAEIAACRPWLDSEIAVVKPKVVVCLGATAAQALLGKSFKVTQRRGELPPTSCRRRWRPSTRRRSSAPPTTPLGTPRPSGSWRTCAGSRNTWTDRRQSMRADLVVGGRLPDLELPDHRRPAVRLSKLAAGYPLVVSLYRGYW